MQSPERFSDLPEHAFPRLRALLAGHPPGGPELAMSIGEPRHPPPPLIAETIAAHAADFGRYPPNDGAPDLRAAIAGWLRGRYGLTVDPEREVFPLNGSREGLFGAALALSPETKAGARPVVLTPNPFYAAYGAAAAAVGAEPVPVAATAATGFLPDYASLPPALLDRVTLAYVCSPSNPQGSVADAAYWRTLIDTAERHDFTIISDECYSEIYRATPPPGVLEVARGMDADPERVLIFQSLSKRSSAPGLRAGFAAGGPKAIAALRQLRAYGGAPPPLPLQAAAAALWRDEAHVAVNRGLYADKLALADRLLGDLPGYAPPEAGFYLWLRTGDGEAATLRLWRTAGVKALPGAYLGRARPGEPNPGHEYIRIALVAGIEDVARGLGAIRDVLTQPQPAERV